MIQRFLALLLSLTVILLFTPGKMVYAASFPTVIGTNDTGVVSGAQTTLTVSHTVPGGSQNVDILVLVASYGTITGVNWNGSAMTKLADNLNVSPICTGGSANSSFQSYWYFTATTTGAGVATATFGSSNRVSMHVESWQDVAVGNPLDVAGCATQASGTTLSKSITTTTNNDAIIDSAANDPNTKIQGVPVAQFVMSTTTNATNNDAVTSSYLIAGAPTAGSYTMTRNLNSAGVTDLLIISLKYLAPLATGSTVNDTDFFQLL